MSKTKNLLGIVVFPLSIVLLMTGCSGVSIKTSGQSQAESACIQLAESQSWDSDNMEENLAKFKEIGSLAAEAAYENDKYSDLNSYFNDLENSFYSGNLDSTQSAWSNIADECNIILK